MRTELKLLFARRSVRAFEDRDVPQDMVSDLLAAGMSAPSACAKDPWRIVIVRKPSVRAGLAAALPNGRFLEQAPVGLIVCGELSAAHDGQLSYLLQDCSACIENMLLAAAAVGLGACWLGVHPREERIHALRAMLKLPEGILPVAAIALGWPTRVPEPRNRYDETKVHHESW